MIGVVRRAVSGYLEMMKTHRGMVSISPLVLLLAVILAGLIGWKTTVQLGVIAKQQAAGGAFTSDFFVSKQRSKVITTNVTAFLICLAIAGGVGAACYFVFGKSDTAANIGVGAPLLLAVGLFAFQAFRYVTASPTGPPVAAGTGGVQSQLGGAPVDQVHTPPPPIVQRPQPVTVPPRRDGNSTPAAQPGVSQPQPPPPNVQAPAPVPTPAPEPPTRVMPGGPEFTPAAEYAGGDSEAAVAALRDLGSALDAAIGEVQADLEALAKDAANPPRHERGALKARRERAQALKNKADGLESRLKGAQDAAEGKLREAGLSEFDARRASMEFANITRCMARSFACAELSRLAGNVLEETTLLEENFAKWKLNAAKEVESQNRMLESKARSARFMIRSGLEQRERTLDRLRAP